MTLFCLEHFFMAAAELCINFFVFITVSCLRLCNLEVKLLNAVILLDHFWQCSDGFISPCSPLILYRINPQWITLQLRSNSRFERSWFIQFFQCVFSNDVETRQQGHRHAPRISITVADLD